MSTARWINSADRRRDPAPIKTKRRRSHPIGSGGYIHRGRNRHQSQCRSAQPMSQIVIRVVLAADPSLPVYSCKQIISEPAGTSRSANKGHEPTGAAHAGRVRASLARGQRQTVRRLKGLSQKAGYSRCSAGRPTDVSEISRP